MNARNNPARMASSAAMGLAALLMAMAGAAPAAAQVSFVEPAVAPPILPSPPAVVGAGGRGQNAIAPIKSHPANHSGTVVRALGVILLLAVIAAAVWFGVLEPSGRYPAR